MDWHPTTYIRCVQTNGEKKATVKFHRSRLDKFDSLYHQDLLAHFGCVNAVEFSTGDGSFLASGGDDKRVLLWNVAEAMLRPNYRPIKLTASHHSNIFCLAFNNKDTRLVSSGNDGQVILHDLNTLQLVDIFMCDNSVYGLSVSPDNDNFVATACEDGTVHVIDTRLQKSDGICIARSTSAFHSVMFSPVCHHLLATAHSRDGIGLWDIRMPKREVLHYGSRDSKQRGMSARFNQTGSQVICLRRRLPLALFNTNDSECVAEFYCSGYSNSCTMKSCCFAGDQDQYIVSGSDDFGIYVWKVPDQSSGFQRFISKSFKILKGHRSIVNQVRFNTSSNMFVSSGVEKVIKLWSTEPMPLGGGTFKKGEIDTREKYSHHQYLQLILESGEDLIHNYEEENTQEDPRMLAFFDSLVQHEEEGSDSDSSDSDRETTLVAQRNHYFATERMDSESSEAEDEEEPENDGPASLESLGITKSSEESTAKSEVTQKRLRNLRAQIKDDDREWQQMDAADQGPSNKKDAKEHKTNILSEQKLKDRHKPHDGELGGNEENDSLPCTSNSKRRQDENLKNLHTKKKQRKEIMRVSEETKDSDSDTDELSTRMRQRNAKRRARKPFKLRHSSSDGSPNRTKNDATIARNDDRKKCTAENDNIHCDQENNDSNASAKEKQ